MGVGGGPAGPRGRLLTSRRIFNSIRLHAPGPRLRCDGVFVVHGHTLNLLHGGLFLLFVVSMAAATALLGPGAY